MLKRSAPINPLPRWKRALDLTGASIALVVASPGLILVAIYIKLTSPGPVLFKHMRYGYRGEPLYVWKFRSMQVTACPAQHQQYVMNIADEDEDVQLKKMDNDSKLIPLGKWLRCTAIDELPQLFNVLKGDMSLVGPRPDVVPVHKYHDWQQVRFDVVPGLTGLWQVSGKNHTTFNEMNKLDATYVENRSVWLDLKIVILTGPAILKQVAENLFSQNHSN